jgi:hypothetical protein
MAKKKPIDGVIEAVRYSKQGNVELVRAYERRGPTYSDVILLSRLDLIMRLTSHKRYVVGTRKEHQGSTFDIMCDVRLVGESGHELLLSEGATPEHDDLDPAPIF